MAVIIYDFASNIAGRKCDTYCRWVLMLETIFGNIMMIQAYIQGQRSIRRSNYAEMCNLLLAGESFSGISVVIQGHPQSQKVNFKVTKCEHVMQKENRSQYNTSC